MTPRDHLSEFYRWRGQAAAEEGQWPQAVAAYAKASRLEPDDPMRLLDLAGALARAGDAPAAWPLMVRAARLNPYSAAVHNIQAQWLAERGRAEEALGQMGEAIRRYPSNVGYRLERARMLLKAGRTEQARQDLEYIEKNSLPIWEYEEESYRQLRAAAGMAPAARTALNPRKFKLNGEPR